MNPTSLEEAYRCWARELVAFASALTRCGDAPDAVADVFERLLADPTAWHEVRDPRRYLFKSVANAVRARGRSAQRRRLRERTAFDRDRVLTRAHGNSTGSDVLIDDDISEALDALSPQQRAVVFLTYWMDEPVDQVADILGVRPGTVRRQLGRARRRIRGALT